MLRLIFIHFLQDGPPVIRKDGYCVTYKSSPTYPKVTQPFNKPAPVTDDKTYKLLKEVCPYLAHKKQSETHACCDLTQLQNLQKNLKTAATLFSRCPASTQNFNNIWCEFTCSPNQSTFLDYRYNKIVEQMTEATYYVSEKFANDLYNSVKSVAMPSTNGKVIDLMCTSRPCSPQKFLDFMGDKSNAPYKIDFAVNKTTVNITNNNVAMMKCNESFYDEHTSRNVSKCSCQDCTASCPIPPKPPAPKRYDI